MRLTPFLNHEAVKIRWCLPVRGSILSGTLPLAYLGLESVDLRSPSPQGQPVGLRAERSDGFKYHHRSTPSENTSKGVLLTRDECRRS